MIGYVSSFTLYRTSGFFFSPVGTQTINAAVILLKSLRQDNNCRGILEKKKPFENIVGKGENASDLNE